MVLASCLIPETDLPLRSETIERWLADGLARISFRGRAVLYDGGNSDPLTLEERQAEYSPRVTRRDTKSKDGPCLKRFQIIQSLQRAPP